MVLKSEIIFLFLVLLTGGYLMTQSATGHFDNTSETKSAKKPWSLYEVGAMVGGFVVFWPLGLLALFLKFKNGEMWKGSSASMTPWASCNWQKTDMSKWTMKSGSFSNSGNAAFDDYKRNALASLEAERRKLDDEQRAFAAHLAKLRQAKDQDEFDRFMAERNAPTVAE